MPHRFDDDDELHKFCEHDFLLLSLYALHKDINGLQVNSHEAANFRIKLCVFFRYIYNKFLLLYMKATTKHERERARGKVL